MAHDLIARDRSRLVYNKLHTIAPQKKAMFQTHKHPLPNIKTITKVGVLMAKTNVQVKSYQHYFRDN